MVSRPNLSGQVARPWWSGGLSLASLKWQTVGPTLVVSQLVVRWPKLGQPKMAVSQTDLSGQLSGSLWSGDPTLATPKWQSVGPTLVVSQLGLGDHVAQPWLVRHWRSVSRRGKLFHFHMHTNQTKRSAGRYLASVYVISGQLSPW